MSLACCKVILYIFAVTWIFWRQDADCAGADRRCISLLRRLLKNPPNNTKIAINIGLSKARYLCRDGFNLAGQELRTCKRGKWTDDKEPKCMRPCGKPENTPHSRVVGSSFNFNDQLRYICLEGYTLNGPKVRTCGEDGKWSEAPTCEEIIPCGHRAVNTRAKIVGGEISQKGMWPWQIGLYRLNRNVPKYICGGALVSRQWVLTAAHCFFSVWGLFSGNANLYLIKAGDHNRSVSEASQQEVVPEMIFVHPRFKWKGTPLFDGDIALVKLSQKLNLTDFIRTVCLPEKDGGEPTIPKTKGTVAGWGVTRSLVHQESPGLNDVSKVLRHATFTIQSDQLCINRSGVEYNSTTAFCAGDGKGGRDTCDGDSGGAFVREDSSAKWVAIGVVSWGNGCAQKDQYGYYTRVYPFLDWIKKTMGENIAAEKGKIH